MNRIKTNLYDYVSLKPFKYIEPSIHTVTIAKVAVLLPYLALLFLTESWNSLVIIASAIAASIVCESLDVFYSRKTPFKWLNTLSRAFIIGLLLPCDFPPLAVFFVTLSTILMIRYVLGGFADTWVNTAAVAVSICWLIGANLFPEFSLTRDILQTKNPSLSLIQSGIFPVLSFDAPVTTSLNDSIFSLFKVNVPEGYVSLLLDSQSVIPAFRFNLLTLFVSIVLFSFNFLKPLIPAVFIAVYTLLVRFACPLFGAGLPGNGDVLLALLTSGTLFSSIFLLQYIGTLPVTTAGKVIYGIVCGIFAFLIMGPGDSSIGFVFTVLVANIISPVIQYFEHVAVENHVMNNLLKNVQQVKEGKNA